MITGGQSTNSVAASCTIQVDRRTLPGEAVDEVLGEFEAVLDDVRADGVDVSLELDKWADAAETPPGMRVAALLAEARDSLGIEGYELGYSATTDARYLINDAHVPAVIFGPGDIHLAHTVGEYVGVDALANGARVYAEAYAKILEAV
jgi:acetylornithine deacetylase/succinyl-diaminopimelate desuccinylase